jgi:heme exporter protein D
MSVFGNHGGFILAAYVVFVAVLVGLVAWIVIDGRALKRRLADLEARGIRRRSARSGTTNE